MPHFIVDLEVIRCLEVSLRKKLKPEEILLVSYIKSFPKGYYGSKEKLASVLGVGERKVFEILKFFKEGKNAINPTNIILLLASILFLIFYPY
jgi:hypothetical protein